MGERGGGRRLAVVGQGYVGLPLALRACDQGFDVIGFDVDQDKVARLRRGRSHVEDVTSEELAAVLASGRYRPTDDSGDLVDFDVAVITVPTPLREGAPDVSHIEAATEVLAPHLRPRACVVLESTTYPGTTDEIVAPLLERVDGDGGGQGLPPPVQPPSAGGPGRGWTSRGRGRRSRPGSPMTRRVVSSWLGSGGPTGSSAPHAVPAMRGGPAVVYGCVDPVGVRPRSPPARSSTEAATRCGAMWFVCSQKNGDSAWACNGSSASGHTRQPGRGCTAPPGHGPPRA